jgi:hypothetical protein
MAKRQRNINKANFGRAMKMVDLGISQAMVAKVMGYSAGIVNLWVKCKTFEAYKEYNRQLALKIKSKQEPKIEPNNVGKEYIITEGRINEIFNDLGNVSYIIEKISTSLSRKESVK